MTPSVAEEGESQQNSSLECVKCGLRYTQMSNLYRHMRQQHWKEVYRCHLCRRCFPGREALMKHQTSHSKMRWKCPECPRTFSSPSNCSRHIRSCPDPHKSIKNHYFKCSQCSMRFLRRENLTKHMRGHGKQKLFNCNECCMTFYNKSILVAHQIIHLKVQSVPCPCCTQVFSGLLAFRDHLEGHVRNLTNEPSNVIETAGSKPVKESPRRCQRGNELFRCRNCGHKFVSRIHFKQHGSRCLLKSFTSKDCAVPRENSTFHPKDCGSTHPKSLFVICKACERVFSSHKSLALHYTQQHSLPAVCVLR